MAYKNVAALRDCRRELLRHVLADVDTQLLSCSSRTRHNYTSILSYQNSVASWCARDMRCCNLQAQNLQLPSDQSIDKFYLQNAMLQGRPAKTAHGGHALTLMLYVMSCIHMQDDTHMHHLLGQFWCSRHWVDTHIFLPPQQQCNSTTGLQRRQ